VSPITQGFPSPIHFLVVVEEGVPAVVVEEGVPAVVVVLLVGKHVGGFGSLQLSVPPHPPQQVQGLSLLSVAASAGLTHSV
jgi:hypothetical protein